MTDNPTTKFLLDRVATVYAQLSDPEQVAALRQTPGALHELEREYDDLRAAMIGIRHPEEAPTRTMLVSTYEPGYGRAASLGTHGGAPHPRQRGAPGAQRAQGRRSRRGAGVCRSHPRERRGTVELHCCAGATVAPGCG
jgi:hypothetical protein